MSQHTAPNRRSGHAARLWAALIALVAALLPAYPVAGAAHEAAAVAPAFAPTTQPAAPLADANDEIVYLDAAGFIRVLDPVAAGGGPQLIFMSPEGNFTEIALGDFNNDSDMEIIAIKGNPGEPFRVVIYDPVVARGITVPGQQFNGVPWVKLLDLTVPFRPILVGAGNFDAGVPGDEFLIVTEVPEGSRPSLIDLYKLDIYKQTSQTPDGRSWVPHIANRYFEEGWTRFAAGDVIVGGTEEFAVADEVSGRLSVFRVDSGLVRIHQMGDPTKPFIDVAMGNFDGLPGMEIAGVRKTLFPLGSLFMLSWVGNQFEEIVATAHYPEPRRIVFSDVNGSGDDELFLLRDVPAGVGHPRLFNRNSGSDVVHEWAEALEDNEWRVIAAGDTDGDARGEIIIMRAERIRIYNQPERDSATYQDFFVSTNSRSIVTGNLDAIGFTVGPVLAPDTELVEVKVAAGLTKDATLRLSNTGTAAAVPFAVTVEGSTPWLSVSPPSGSTPTGGADALITLTFDASGLAPGIYRTRVIITSSDAAVTNDPVFVEITLEVTPATLSASPGNINIGGEICAANVLTPTLPVSTTVQVQVIGSPGLPYAAAIFESPTVAAAAAGLSGELAGASIDGAGVLSMRGADGSSAALPGSVSAPGAGGIIPEPFTWMTATKTSGVVPDTITIQIEKSSAFTETVQATLLLVGGSAAGAPPTNLRLAPLNICPGAVLHLPVAYR